MSIPGITLTNGATTITVAPMNLRIQFDDETKDDVALVTSGEKQDAKAFTLAAINVVLACARRNHPNLTREQLLDVMDAADLGPTLVAVLYKSGFKPRPLASSGETSNEAPSPSPAPESSASSSTEPAGPVTTSSTA